MNSAFILPIVFEHIKRIALLIHYPIIQEVSLQPFCPLLSDVASNCFLDFSRSATVVSSPLSLVFCFTAACLLLRRYVGNVVRLLFTVTEIHRYFSGYIFINAT
ncbi:hypothetical protein ACJX0J_039720 [Zea mays]